MSDDQPEDSVEVSTDYRANTDENGECFVIAPIGDPRTETRRQTDGLLNEAIRPVVEEEMGLDVTAAHELPEAGSITRQVIQRLLEAELVVADLTGLNANVMYELAIRHAKGKPVVPIAEKGTDLPFDITTERTVFYEESFHGLNELKPKIKDAAHAALEDEEADNPVYRAQQDFQMREAIAGDDKMGYLMDRLDSIESLISNETPVYLGSEVPKEGNLIPIDVDRLTEEEMNRILGTVEKAHELRDLDFEAREIDAEGETSHLMLLVPREILEETEKIVNAVVDDSRYEVM